MPLAVGSRIGPYQITALIGAGGMGEVYRATDTRLGRDVAIKALPADLAGDAERLARLRREAQVLAQLNHPNIAAIHGLEETGGTPLLVLELVEGEDLAARLQRGAVPIDEAIVIARHIAEGLEEAHVSSCIRPPLRRRSSKSPRRGARRHPRPHSTPPARTEPTVGHRSCRTAGISSSTRRSGRERSPGSCAWGRSTTLRRAR